MPAATPKPTLEELLIILSRFHYLEAGFSERGLINDPDTITLKYTFKREHLGPAAKFVFEYPSTIFSSLKEHLEFDDVMEKAFRQGDPRNTISDVIAYIEQKRAYVRGLNGLSDRMDEAFLESTLKYLRELDRRRREADRREKEAAQARRKRDEEEIKRTVEEEILRREQERQRTKEEARRRWEEEEAKKRKWQGRQISDSGYDQKREQPKYDNPFENMFRDAGIDPNDPIFKDAFYKASYGGFGNSFYEGSKSHRQSPPPSNGKRKWFETLGCHPAASRDEVRRAAREAAKGLHPDIPGQNTPENQARIREINEAKAEGLKGCKA